MKWADIPKQKTTFIKLNDRKQEVLVVSEPHPWTSHYDPRINRSYRCGGPRCYPCSVGVQKQLRVVVMIIDGRGREWLFELRERHRERFDKYERMTGLRLHVWKAGQAKNSPVEAKVINEEYAMERDISRLVATLGLPPILIGELELSHPEELQPAPFGETSGRFE